MTVQSTSLGGSNINVPLTLLFMINAMGVEPSTWAYTLFNIA